MDTIEEDYRVFMVKGHRADDIGKDMEKCLAEWGLDKVFTITVDNASANNGAVSYMAKVTNKSKTSILESKLLTNQRLANNGAVSFSSLWLLHLIQGTNFQITPRSQP